jgi:hypothetical protein
MPDDQQIREKLAKIKALFAGAGEQSHAADAPACERRLAGHPGDPSG